MQVANTILEQGSMGQQWSQYVATIRPMVGLIPGASALGLLEAIADPSAIAVEVPDPIGARRAGWDSSARPTRLAASQLIADLIAHQRDGRPAAITGGVMGSSESVDSLGWLWCQAIREILAAAVEYRAISRGWVTTREFRPVLFAWYTTRRIEEAHDASMCLDDMGIERRQYTESEGLALLRGLRAKADAAAAMRRMRG